MKSKKKYTYTGPVFHFQQCCDRQWTAETWAVSRKSALNQLAYRYKTQIARCVATAKFSLDEKYLKEVAIAP